MRTHNYKMIAVLVLVMMTAAGLASCGGGGGSSSVGSGDQMTILPPTGDTPAGAIPIALGEGFQGRIDSPDDVDHFRLQVAVPGRLTIRTTGNADPDIAVFDGAGNEVGNEVPGVSGSWVGSITQDILDRGNSLLVRFSGGNVGGGGGGGGIHGKGHARATVANLTGP